MGFNSNNNSSMIADILKLLKSNPFYGCSENIEIAKGKYAIAKDWKDSKQKIIRYRYWVNRK